MPCGTAGTPGSTSRREGSPNWPGTSWTRFPFSLPTFGRANSRQSLNILKLRAANEESYVRDNSSLVILRQTNARLRGPDMKALILAGGQGLRLRPLTEDKPKPLVLVNERPIAEWQIDWLKREVALDEVVFLCGYKWDCLKEHFGTSYGGVAVSYSVEDTPLGTGGAIRKALTELHNPSENVVVMNGDIITSLPLKN